MHKTRAETPVGLTNATFEHEIRAMITILANYLRRSLEQHFVVAQYSRLPSFRFSQRWRACAVTQYPVPSWISNSKNFYFGSFWTLMPTNAFKFNARIWI